MNHTTEAVAEIIRRHLGEALKISLENVSEDQLDAIAEKVQERMDFSGVVDEAYEKVCSDYDPTDHGALSEDDADDRYCTSDYAREVASDEAYEAISNSDTICELDSRLDDVESSCSEIADLVSKVEELEGIIENLASRLDSLEVK